MVAAWVVASLGAALVTYFTYFRRLRGPWRLGLMGLRFLGVLGVFLLAWNPACNRVDSVQTKPLAVVLLDQSASFRPFQKSLPAELGNALDTLCIPFGNDSTTSVEEALDRAVRRLAGRPASAVWLQTDGVVNQGISLRTGLARLGNPPTFAVFPKDSLPKNGWECVSLRFPDEAIKGELCKGTVVLRHQGRSSQPQNWSLQWGSERVAAGSLPAAQSERLQTIEFSWRPETPGVRTLQIVGSNEKKQVRVVINPPTLVVMGKKIHPDAAYFVAQLTNRRNARVYYRGDAPNAQDFQADLWLITGGQTVVGEERFSGSLVRLPSIEAVVPASNPPIWPGETVSPWAVVGSNWFVSTKPNPTDWSASPLRWEVANLGFAAASRKLDSAGALLPGALVDRLWSSKQDRSFSIRFPDKIWALRPLPAVAVWPGWSASEGSTYPEVKMEYKQVNDLKSAHFTPKNGQLESILPGLKPGIVRYRAVGSYGGITKELSGEFQVESVPNESIRPSDFQELRALTQANQGEWAWISESQVLAQKMADDSRFLPQMSEQKKSRQWRDLWGAFLLAALPLGMEAILRKRRTGRA